MTYFERLNIVEIVSSVGCSKLVEIGSNFGCSKFVEIRSNSDIQNKLKSDRILDVLNFLKQHPKFLDVISLWHAKEIEAYFKGFLFSPVTKLLISTSFLQLIISPLEMRLKLG